MYRPRQTKLALGLLTVALTVASGCSFAPRWSRLSGPKESHTAQLAAAAESFDRMEGEAPPTPPERGAKSDSNVRRASDQVGMYPSKPPDNSDSPKLKAFIAELEKYPEVELEQRNQILENLRETEPSLLDVVIRQYRASFAYRRQLQEKARESLPADLELATAKPEVAEAEPSRSQVPEPPQPPAEAVAVADEPADPSPPPVSEAEDPPAEPPAPVVLAATTTAPAPLPGSSKEDDSPDDPIQPSASERPDNAAPLPKSALADRVVPASFEAKLPAEWRDQLEAAIGSLESAAKESPESPEEIADHARLRLLHLAARHRDEALRPIPTLEPGMTDFWNKEVFALATLLDTKMIPDPVERISEAKIHFEEAVARLSESAPLVVRNLAFITKVTSYGVYTPFDAYEFRPGQRVGLYVEVDNFASKEGPQGFHTSLKSGYQILDNLGHLVGSDEFVPNRENCRNRRRDYFIFYEFSLPERIYPGQYTLQLTVTDVNSQKVGQAQVQFYIADRED